MPQPNTLSRCTNNLFSDACSWEPWAVALFWLLWLAVLVGGVIIFFYVLLPNRRRRRSNAAAAVDRMSPSPNVPEGTARGTQIVTIPEGSGGGQRLHVICAVTGKKFETKVPVGMVAGQRITLQVKSDHEREAKAKGKEIACLFACYACLFACYQLLVFLLNLNLSC